MIAVRVAANDLTHAAVVPEARMTECDRRVRAHVMSRADLTQHVDWRDVSLRERCAACHRATWWLADDPAHGPYCTACGNGIADRGEPTEHDPACPARATRRRGHD